MSHTLLCIPTEAMAYLQLHPSFSVHIEEVFDGLLHNAPAHLGVGTADVKPTILNVYHKVLSLKLINKQDAKAQHATTM